MKYRFHGGELETPTRRKRRELSAWDVAAGILLVKEAGGMVEGLRKGTDPLDGALIAGNDGLFDAFSGTLRG